MVVCKQELWPRMESHIAQHTPKIVAKYIAGQDPSHFNLDELHPQLPIAVLGGSDETFEVLKWFSGAPAMDRLRWIHSYCVGVDSLRLPELAGWYRHVPVSNARAASSHLLSEHIALAMLYFNRGVPQRMAQQKSKTWRVMNPLPCHGQTVGILGYGDIGKAVARTSKHGFAMNVLGYTRSQHGPTDSIGTRLLSGPEGLKELVTYSDFIVNALPLTRDTENFIDQKFLAAMKPSAVLINVGRGATVVEDHLLDALQHGTIRGAALDVFRAEPLPEHSPFWALGPDKMFVTAHDGAPNFHCGGVDAAMRQFMGYATDFVTEHRLPPYLVDLDRGY